MVSIKRHKPIILLTMAASLLFGSDMVFDFLASLFHVLIVIVHYLFEFSESSLDSIIEHLFHTSRRATQIIVFYIMTGILSAVVFLVLRSVPGWYRMICNRLKTYYVDKKIEAIDFWRQQTLLLKIKLCTQIMVGTFTILFFAFS